MPDPSFLAAPWVPRSLWLPLGSPRFPPIALHPGCPTSVLDLFLPLPGRFGALLNPVHLVTYSRASLSTCFHFLAHSTLWSGSLARILSPLLDYQLQGFRIHMELIFVSSAVPGTMSHSGGYLILIE